MLPLLGKVYILLRISKGTGSSKPGCLLNTGNKDNYIFISSNCIIFFQFNLYLNCVADKYVEIFIFPERRNI